jgi:hypothetical protein
MVRLADLPEAFFRRLRHRQADNQFGNNDR